MGAALSVVVFLRPRLFTAHLMSYLLPSFFIQPLLCGLITAAALLPNSRIIISFIVLIRVSVSAGLRSVFTAPAGGGQRRTDGADTPQVNIYTCEGAAAASSAVLEGARKEDAAVRRQRENSCQLC